MSCCAVNPIEEAQEHAAAGVMSRTIVVECVDLEGGGELWRTRRYALPIAEVPPVGAARIPVRFSPGSSFTIGPKEFSQSQGGGISLRKDSGKRSATAAGTG